MSGVSQCQTFSEVVVQRKTKRGKGIHISYLSTTLPRPI